MPLRYQTTLEIKADPEPYVAPIEEASVRLWTPDDYRDEAALAYSAVYDWVARLEGHPTDLRGLRVLAQRCPSIQEILERRMDRQDRVYPRTTDPDQLLPFSGFDFGNTLDRHLSDATLEAARSFRDPDYWEGRPTSLFNQQTRVYHDTTIAIMLWAHWRHYRNRRPSGPGASHWGDILPAIRRMCLRALPRTAKMSLHLLRHPQMSDYKRRLFRQHARDWVWDGVMGEDFDRLGMRYYVVPAAIWRGSYRDQRDCEQHWGRLWDGGAFYLRDDLPRRDVAEQLARYIEGAHTNTLGMSDFGLGRYDRRKTTTSQITIAYIHARGWPFRRAAAHLELSQEIPHAIRTGRLYLREYTPWVLETG